VSVYLKELKKYFTKVVLLSSKDSSSEEDKRFLLNEGIEFKYEKNEGFDFGMWYKAFQKYDLNSYDQVALVNDSCVLFKPLNDFMNWSASNHADAKGITLSDAISPHIQSYFIVLNKKAINLTAAYFKEHKLLNDIADVITTYEVGLSNYLIKNGAKISAFIDNNGYAGEFSPSVFRKLAQK
jgi:lipopolysaccharide biosynthesis protein